VSAATDGFRLAYDRTGDGHFTPLEASDVFAEEILTAAARADA